MNGVRRAIVRAILPLTVFGGVAAFHFVWLGLFPEKGQAEESCEGECACEAPTRLGRYMAGQSYWLGYSYAGSLTFAATALRRYRERRLCTARNLAIGGVTVSGVLAVVGCYLLGCCGSPMLPIYLSLFGAAFVPLAKPLVAGLTTLSLLAAWWWVRRQERRAAHAGLAPANQMATACCASEAACCQIPDDDTSAKPAGQAS
jgi:hypothetical protein